MRACVRACVRMCVCACVRVLPAPPPPDTLSLTDEHVPDRVWHVERRVQVDPLAVDHCLRAPSQDNSGGELAPEKEQMGAPVHKLHINYSIELHVTGL
eukprot:6206225-Pleurochrysis_carterae.AAC.3